MEEADRSGGGGSIAHSGGGIVKSRSSTGCLIIKKKVDGAGSSRPPIVYQSKKEKKRLRMIASDSGPSDNEMVELYRRRGMPGPGRVSTGSVVYNKGVIRKSDPSRKNRLVYGNHEARDRKRSKLDVYEFDEYDDLTDVEMMRMFPYSEREFEGSGRSFLHTEPVMRDCSGRTFDSGSNRHNFDSRKNMFPRGRSTEKFRDHSIRKKNDLSNELPIAMLKQKFGSSSAEPIRLQGKNGVLKVMVNKKKIGASYNSQAYVDARGDNTVSNSLDIAPINTMVHAPFYSEKKPQNKLCTPKRPEMSMMKSQKHNSSESSDNSDELSESSDSEEACKSLKRTAGDEGGIASPDVPSAAKSRGGKVKCGSGTEKQLLREKIRSMLTTAGWTIDYRPRRNRDYFDAVYINPTGTAYWSIIKAYDALQKQLAEEGAQVSKESSPFAPISGEVLNKLTRQTRKKMEKERKKKKDVRKKKKKEIRGGKVADDDYDTDDSGSVHEEKISSFVKQNGKSSKGRLQEGWTSERISSTIKVQDRGDRSSSASNHRLTHGRKTNKIDRCTLLVRSSGKGINSGGDDFVPYTGKRTLLSWLIDSGIVQLSEKVHYMNRRRTRIMLEGWITRDGVHCGCCSKILTVSKFEIHAASKLRQPFQNIYLSSGVSLMQCQVDAWNRQDECHRKGFYGVDVDGDDPNDDTCGICGDGGDLICCDGCPSTFHQTCLDIEMLPAGDWHCPHCSCKFCGRVEVATADRNDLSLGLLQRCNVCERKCHPSCVQETQWISTSPNDAVAFCGQSCGELYEGLQKLLGVKHELESGLSWSLIHRTDLDSDMSLRGLSPRVEWNSKLAVALTVMDECFLPIVDRRSGINLIHNVLYNCGSNFNRLNYSGFYTAILERGDEIISAASIRIHGTRLAEMPFIGTRHIYRRQGMCRRLFLTIESALQSLKVEMLIIPAISELMHTWTGVFGFSIIHESLKHQMKSMNMLVFPGIDMLQKELLPRETLKTDEGVMTGSNSLVPDISNCRLSHEGNAATTSGLCHVERNDMPIADIAVRQPASSFKAASSNSDEDKQQDVRKGSLDNPDSRIRFEDRLVVAAPHENVQLSTSSSTEIVDQENFLVSSPTAHDHESKADDAASQLRADVIFSDSCSSKGHPFDGPQETEQRAVADTAVPDSDPLEKTESETEGKQGYFDSSNCEFRAEEYCNYPAENNVNKVSSDGNISDAVPAEKTNSPTEGKYVPSDTSCANLVAGEHNSNSLFETCLLPPAECGSQVNVHKSSSDGTNSNSDPREKDESVEHFGASVGSLAPEECNICNPVEDCSDANDCKASVGSEMISKDRGEKSQSESRREHVALDAVNGNLVTDALTTGLLAETGDQFLADQGNDTQETTAGDDDALVANSCLDACISNVGVVCGSQTDEYLVVSGNDLDC